MLLREWTQEDALPQTGQVMGRFGEFRQEWDAARTGQVLLFQNLPCYLAKSGLSTGMRSQHKFVITAGLLCHLFLIAPLVTSQARADQTAQDSAAPAELAVLTSLNARLG